MKKKLLHTPEGVRDIYNEECEKKLILQEHLHQVLTTYGYHPIQTPTFEFFDIFSEQRGTVNFSIYLEKKLEPFRPANYINFLTVRAILLC